MDHSETMGNLGTPLGADLGAIERELAEFWGAASQDPSEPAALRACSCNFIVIVPEQTEAEALPPVLADVAEWHPCRSLVAFRELENADAGLPPVRAWMRVQCRRQLGGGPQVCSEVITLGVKREAAAGLADTLISLLVPDLPVFLYWRSPRGADRGLIETISRFADLLIVDSQRPLTDMRNREQVMELLTGAARGAEIRDLSWSRLTAWRDLIAQFFDARPARSLLKELAEVEIQRVPSSPGTVPVLALLLAGWLASRLDWQTASAERKEGEWICHMRGPGGEAMIRFLSTPADTTQTGIEAVTLKTRDGSSFSVVAHEEQACMTATAATPAGEPMVVHTVPRPSTSEADLLIGELSVLGEDTGFRAALGAALELERSFR